MTREELQQHLTLSGYETKRDGADVCLRVCVFCGNDRYNLGLDPAVGLYGCWNCKAGGRVDDLLRRLTGGEFHIPVQDTGPRTSRQRAAPEPDFKQVPATELHSARHYLHRRGLDDDAIARYELTVCLEPGHRLEHRILIPAYDYWTRARLGHVGRSYTSRRPKYLTTVPHRTVTGYRVRERLAPVVAVEGQFDGIAVHRAGFNTAILSGTSSDVEEFAARTLPEAPLFLLLDPEAAEQARRLQARISAIRDVHTIPLPPGRDPADFTPAVLRKLIERYL